MACPLCGAEEVEVIEEAFMSGSSGKLMPLVFQCMNCHHQWGPGIDEPEEQSDVCPIKPPKLLKADSIVETCAQCGTWVDRWPAFLGDPDYYWSCEKCGNTSVMLRPGRPYGPKSSKWPDVVKMFEDLYLDIPHWDWNTVKTEPSMASLDWAAVEAWFRSQGIYRMFIGVTVADAMTQERE